ncbi:MAG: SDR family oxidoreductase [Flavobacteriales bacterium]
MTNSLGRVLLTGATGLVATHISELFSESDDLVLTSRSTVANTPFHFEHFDWRNTDEIKSFLKSVRPKTIIHTAGVTSVDYAELNKQETGLVNVAAVQEMVSWCKLNDCRLVHFSTDFVFDGELGMYSEANESNPLSYYGSSKLKSEQIVLTGLVSSIVIRTVLVYGYNAQLSRLNFPLWLKQQLEQGVELSITADQFRTPTYAEDLAKATILLARSNVSGLFHVGGPQYMSVFDFALLVCDEFNLNRELIKPSKTEIMNQSGKRPLKTGFDISKVSSQIDYQPVNVIDGLTLMHQRMISE